MKPLRPLIPLKPFFFIIALLISLLGPCCANAEPAAGKQPDLAACRAAQRILTSNDYVQAHRGEIPDADKLTQLEQSNFIIRLFHDTLSKSEDQELFCTNTIRDNLKFSIAGHLPAPCPDFLPGLKKSFEAKIVYKTDIEKQVQDNMDDSLTEMLILNETTPAQLVARCQVGIEVMKVNLNDKHLAQRYPLPVTCEAFFAEMEKTLILPAQLETLRRQRVIFFLENKNTPDKLDLLCHQISQ